MFGKDGGKELAKEYSLDLLAQLPLVELHEDSDLQNHELLKREFDNISTKVMGSVKNLKDKRSGGIPQINITK